MVKLLLLIYVVLSPEYHMKQLIDDPTLLGSRTYSEILYNPNKALMSPGAMMSVMMYDLSTVEVFIITRDGSIAAHGYTCMDRVYTKRDVKSLLKKFVKKLVTDGYHYFL